MTYNECETCHANNGRAGLLKSASGGPFECLNCSDTRESGNIVVHSNLTRTSEELQLTMAIITGAS